MYEHELEEEWETEWNRANHAIIRQRKWEIFDNGNFADINAMLDWHTEA